VDERYNSLFHRAVPRPSSNREFTGYRPHIRPLASTPVLFRSGKTQSAFKHTSAARSLTRRVVRGGQGARAGSMPQPKRVAVLWPLIERQIVRALMT